MPAHHTSLALLLRRTAVAFCVLSTVPVSSHEDAASTSLHAAVCVAGQARTLLEEDVLSHFRAAIVEPLRPALFFQVSVEDSTQRDGDWHAIPARFRSPPPLRDAVLRELARFQPETLNVTSDAELESHPRWRGNFGGGFAHVAFRWALCMDDIEALERRRGRPFRWIVRMRPDLTWKCRLPAQLSLWPAVNVLFRNDYVVLLRRHMADVAMRQYPLSWGFPPCDGPNPSYPEHCGYLLALRSGASIRWTWDLADIRRSCSSSNGSWTGCDQAWQVRPTPTADCRLRSADVLMLGPQPNVSLAQDIKQLFPKLAAEPWLAFMSWAVPSDEMAAAASLPAAEESLPADSAFVLERCVYQGPRTPHLAQLSSKAAVVRSPAECGALLDREETFGLANEGECWFCAGCSFERFGTVDEFNEAAMCGALGGAETIQVYRRRQGDANAP